MGSLKDEAAGQSAEPPPPDRGTHRVEGFSDGFFAIVITLLVLDLRPPRAGEALPTSILHAAPELQSALIVYVVSFVNIYILWVVHHELVRITTRADTRFLYLNGGLLLGVAIMPFSTAVLGDHIADGESHVAAALYTGPLLWVALFYNLIWRYLSGHPSRLLPTVTRVDRRRIARTYAMTLALYAIAFGVSFILPWVAILITLALALFFAVIDRVSGFASEDIAETDAD